ncbi:MAG: transcriptional repressor, partial [Lachnospiraceae bacterium]|nr:transcriptional repressor [Lachnospiraceae bacterium]
ADKKVGDFKEIYFEISKKDPGIGQATVYRMLLTLEEIGAIQRVQGYVVNELYVKPAV